MRTESWTPKEEFNRCTQKNRKTRHSKDTALCNRFARMTAESDLIIGSIANDRMFYVLDTGKGNVRTRVAYQNLSEME